jgi:hypothetical protein
MKKTIPTFICFCRVDSILVIFTMYNRKTKSAINQEKEIHNVVIKGKVRKEMMEQIRKNE